MLLLATWIATERMPKLRREMDKEEQAYESFRFKQELSTVEGLYASNLDIERRIDFLDAALEARIVGDEKRQTDLLNQSLNKTIQEINFWNSWFNEESTIFKMLPEKLHNVSQVKNRIAELEPKLKEAKEKALERLKEQSGSAQKHKNNKGSIEKKYCCWESSFRWLQILGLILLGISEIADKLIASRTKGQDK